MSVNYSQIRLGGKNDKAAVLQLQKLLNEQIGAGLDMDGIFGPKTDRAVRNYQRSKGLTVDGIVGPKTWSMLLQSTSGGTQPTQKRKSDQVLEEIEALEATAPGDFNFSQQDLWQAALEAYQNQGPFNYDPNLDPMYQQHRTRLMTQGKQAMEDTLGMIQARTGGYGNSYAQTAGQQAYQGYMQELTDLMPQLYELAYGKYSDETARLKADYEMYDEARDKERQAHEEKQRRYDDQLAQKHKEYMDHRANEDAEFAKMLDLIKMGYVPSAEELAAVGLTEAMLAALLANR